MLDLYYPPGFGPNDFPMADPAAALVFVGFVWSGVTYLYYSIFGR